MHRNRPSNEAQTASLKGRFALLSGFLRKRFLPFQQRAPAGKLNGKREILHAPKAGERCGVIPTRQGRLISKQISLENCLLNSVLSSSWRTFFIIAQFSVSRQYRRPSCYRVFDHLAIVYSLLPGPLLLPFTHRAVIRAYFFSCASSSRKLSSALCRFSMMSPASTSGSGR